MPEAVVINHHDFATISSLSSRVTMLSYLLRRVIFALALVFVVSLASFLLAEWVPGDISSTTVELSGGRQRMAEMRARYGLDKPVLEQYWGWLVGALRLDFGQSLVYDRPVTDLIPERAVNTAWLAITALVVASVIGLPLGVVTGSGSGGPLVGVVRVASVVLLSMPPLLTSLFMVFVAARTGWLPIGGMGSARQLVIPAAALGLPIAAMFERIQAQAMAEVIGQPYVLAALARGVPRSRILWRDGLKAALRPVASVYGLVVATLLSGSFAVEMVTSWPGLGRLMVEALTNRDLFLVVGCAVTGAVFLAGGTLLSDVALMLVDPRARE